MQLVSTQKLVPTIYYDFYGNGARFCSGCPILATLKGKSVKV